MLRIALLSSVAVVALAASPVWAQDNAGTFNLGKLEQITVTGQKIDQPSMSEGLISNEDMYKFNTPTLDQAINLIPGAVSSNSGGSRNEQLIYVRGFDRFETPLMMDGIRVYLPADNRLDFGMFLTADIAQIQVEKGYASVLDGPGAMGGAINLVTRKPTQPFEWEARTGAEFGGDGSLNGETAYLMMGTRQDKYYLEASGTVNNQPRWSLSDNYTPTATENGGFRDHSESRDWRVNLKAGFTPNDTDEYSISYTTQSGKKDAPFSVSDPVSTQKDWTWPYWDVQSVYFLSNTAIGDSASLKVKAYYNTFTNGLFSYDNANYTTQTSPKAFRSYYDDYAYGGDVEGDVNIGTADILKGAFFYRRDNHDEWETIYSPFLFTEPHQVTIEDTFSLALENRFHVTPKLDWVLGGSYDWRHLIQAQDYVDPTATAAGVFINYPLADGHAWNGQTALIYTLDDGGNIYANVSDRTRFPTIFDRFSTRFGGATSNPTLKPERAANYEIGGSDTFGVTKVSASVYYSHVTNAIESVPIIFNGTAVTQSQNVGIGNYYGAELSFDTKLSEALNGGVRYTYSKRDINNPGMAGFELTGVPTHQGFIYLTWQALPSLTITPSVLAASDRWTVTTNGLLYYRTGAFGLINFEADWHITPHIDISVGGRNLNDDNYQLTAGFPEAGRTFFLNLRVKS